MRKSIMTVFVAVVACLASQAQSGMKIGYADVDYVMSQLPEMKQVKADLESYNVQLENQLKAKYDEYQKKGVDYRKGAADMIEAVRKEKEQELLDIERRLKQFQQDAQTSALNKQTELMKPIVEKIGKAIEDVAKENGFDYVLNAAINGLDVVIFAKPEHEVSDLVLKKLGVTPKAK